MSHILIIQAHPDHEHSFCSALAATYAQGASTHTTVETLHLATLDFDPILHCGYREIQPLEPDLLDARARIERARHIVWVFPMWWVSTPALLKGFLDRVFLPGWAFSYGEGHGIPKKLLGGRSARVLATMDSPGFWYTLHYRRALKASFEAGTLAFSGFSPITRTLFHSIQKSTPAQRAKMLENVRQQGIKDAHTLPRSHAAIAHS